MTANIAHKLVSTLYPSWPKPTSYLSGGVNGKVYKTEDPGVLLKIVPGIAPQEFTTLKKLQNARYGNQPIVPHFKKNWGRIISLSKLNKNLKENINRHMFNAERTKGKLTVFLMGRAGNANSMTLRNYLRKFRTKANVPRVQALIKRMTEEMWLRGVGHGNLHGGNIIVSADDNGKIKGLWFIDFGRAIKFPIGTTHSKELSKLTDDGNYPSWNSITSRKANANPNAYKAKLYATPRGNTIMRSNTNLLKMAYNVNINENNIAKLRTLINKTGSTRPRTSPRRAKSLSPRRRSNNV
jgi:hypothetical protein